jgi:hypothetical protein
MNVEVDAKKILTGVILFLLTSLIALAGATYMTGLRNEIRLENLQKDVEQTMTYLNDHMREKEAH